ncbi:alpha/beta fold hydrolase [Rhizobium sp. L1K21]|uniref:alpha/beta fold hydrolase n=1 Tax=Rhizobium sp. L1K21 TaxID=2954933 RepID=UPI00209391F5|nr:alpha/beta hydrolase [Rhizobium sp. L1K21]MCO6188420.1 alpha/beta hydrolase [Rhizobium sp. L1K21]
MQHEHYESIWSHLTNTAFRQDWVDVDGIRTRYVHAGSGDRPTVVFVHGIGGSWEAFCANIGPFAEHFQVFALDCLGAGFTDKPEQDIYEMSDYVQHLHGFFAALGIEKASLVGVSMGGWLSVNFAHTYPRMVDRLVLCAASGMRREPSYTPPAATSIANDRSKAIDDPSWSNIANIFTDLIFDPAKRNADFIKLRQTVYRQPEMKGAMKRILAITRTENFNRSALSDDEWRAIEKPVLLVESADDSEHFRKNTQRAHGLLSNSRIVSISKVGHWPQWEDPETFNREAIVFLRDR